MIRVAINGFGRIGRLVARAIMDRSHMTLVAVNDLMPHASRAHLLKYDSIHGCWHRQVSAGDGGLEIDGTSVASLREKDPAHLPWQDMGVDVVLECSGAYTDGAAAVAHIHSGAKRVLISAPGKNVDRTVVFGVNHMMLQDDDRIASNASCTTNCLAPIAKVLHASFGITQGYMTTVHAYTGDQRLVDADHKDLRRARAAPGSMIPTSTGAAKAVGQVLPDLDGKLDGTAIRVPTANVSMVDFTCTTQKEVDVDAVDIAMQEAADGPLSGVLGVNADPLVSVDFNGSALSAVYDKGMTLALGPNMLRVGAWYDNEWAFAQRMLDVAGYWARL